jgi:hypothetical protein
MGSALSGPMSAGLGAAKKSMGGLFRSLKSSVGMALRLGGALSAGLLIKNAASIQSLYRDISFSISKIPGEALNWQQVQSLVEQAVENTGVGAEKLATAFHDVFRATGDLEFSKETIGLIGTTATASGEKVENIAKAAELMRRKFGIGNKEIREGLATFIQLTGSGGKSLDELTGKFAVMAGEAAGAGMEGAEGIKQLLGTLLILDESIGEKADPGLKMMFQSLKRGSSQFKKLQKDSQLKFAPDMKALDKIRKTLTTVKGRAAAELVFTADARQVYDTLAKPFDLAFEEAKKKGLKRTEAVDAGLAAFDENLKNASKTTMTWTDIQRQSAERMEKDPSVLLDRAINKITDAFAQPEMIEALTTVAEKLPVFAKKLAELIDWIVKNPFKAVAAVGGLKVGMAGLGGFAGNLGTQLLPKITGIFWKSGKAATTAATTAAATTTTAATTAAGITKTGALAAKAIGVAGAAAIGAAIGSAVHEHITGAVSEKAAKTMDKASDIAFKARELAVSPTATIEEKMAAAKEIEKQRYKIAGTPATFEAGMGAIASVFTDVKSPTEQVSEKQKVLSDASTDLARSIQLQKAGVDVSRDSLKRFAALLDDVSSAGRATSVTGAARGTSHLSNKPGAEPESG